MTIQEKNTKFVEKFIGSLAVSNKAANTLKSYSADIIQFSKFVEKNSNKSLDEVTFAEVDDYKTHMVVEKNLKPTTVNRKLASLEKFYKYLYSRKVISDNPMKEVDKVKVTEKYIASSLTYDQAKKLLQVVGKPMPGQRYADFTTHRNLFLYTLLLTTGLRIQEALTMRFNQINFEEKFISISGKTGHRNVPFTDDLKKLYDRYMVERDNIKGKINNNEYVFITVRGNKLETQNSIEALHKYCDEANIPRIGNHTLRHSFCSIAIANGESVEQVALIAGHSNSQFTFNVYVHEDKKSLLEVCSKIRF